MQKAWPKANSDGPNEQSASKHKEKVQVLERKMNIVFSEDLVECREKARDT